MIFFEEYLTHDSTGGEVVPYFSSGKWYLGFDRITLTELGRKCNIEETELTMLKLTYGG